MRNESLTAYVLHARPFQDKRAIYQLLTFEQGIVHGIGKKGLPQFVALAMFASGKHALKTLTQIQPVDPSEQLPNFSGQARYASFYINEITIKCLPIENEARHVFEHYAWVVHQLQTQPNPTELRLILRYFEQCLFAELGMAIDWHYDSSGQDIEPNLSYRYVLETGWQAVDDQSLFATDVQVNGEGKHHPNKHNKTLDTGDLILGSAIIGIQQLDWQAILAHFEDENSNDLAINSVQLNALSVVHRQIIDHIFDYKPLQSRILWRQWQQYQT